jgi:hypothetical protein
MIAVVTILSAFALGYLMSSRVAANTTYAVAYLWAFTYQTLYLVLDSFGGGAEPAFTASEFPLSYGLVTLAIFAVGFGLVEVGHRFGTRRRARRTRQVEPAGVA